MAVDGKVVYEVDYDVSNAQKSLGKLKVDVNQVGEKLTGVGDAMTTKVTAPLLAGAGIATATFLKMSSELDELKKSAIGVGAGVEGLQAIQFAGRKAGVESEKMTDTLKKMQEVTTSNSDKFFELGIQLRGANDQLKGTDELFTDLLRVTADMDQQTRNQTLLDLGFTEELTTINKLLDENANFFDNFNQGLDTAISESDISKFEEFNDKLEDIKAELLPIGVEIATQVLPYFQEFAKWFEKDGVKLIDENLPKMIDFVIEYKELIAIIAGAGPVLKVVGGVLSVLGSTAGLVGVAMAYTATATYLAKDSIVDSVEAIGDVFESVMNIILNALDQGGLKIEEFSEILAELGNIESNLKFALTQPLRGTEAIASHFTDKLSPTSRSETPSPTSGRGDVNISNVVVNAKTELSEDNVGRVTGEVMELWSREMQLRGIVK